MAMRASICGEYIFSELGALCAFARGHPVIVRNGDKFLFVVVSRQTKKVNSLRPLPGLRLSKGASAVNGRVLICVNLRKSAVKYLLISLRPLRLCGEILNDSYCFSKLGALCAFARGIFFP